MLDPFKERMLLVILGGLLPSAISLFGLILVSCLVYHYIFGNKQKQPHSTVRHCHCTQSGHLNYQHYMAVLKYR